jgi:hypothetical protein
MFRVAMVAALAVASSLAQAQAYKCKDAQGRISYSSNPCPPGQQAQGVAVQNTGPSYSGRPDAEVGLWETVLVARPRVSHPRENPPKNMAELRAMGEMGHMFGLPLKKLKCGSSPLKEYLSRYPISVQCRRQIDARGGTCTFEDEKPGGTGILSNKEAVTLTGNYWDHLNAKMRFIRVYQYAPSDPVVDESETTIRFLGECKSNMRPGDEYRVAEDGRLMPAK